MQHNKDLSLDSYYFFLPEKLIATQPTYPKESAKLLVYRKESQEIIHTTFHHLFDFIPSDYLIVLNNTKVINARFFAHKMNSKFHITPNQTQEFLYHKALGNKIHLVQIRGKAKQNNLFLANDLQTIIQVKAIRDNGFKEVEFYTSATTNTSIEHFQPLRDSETMQSLFVMEDCKVLAFLEEHGTIPLPPYIKRKANTQDNIDYQSIFASISGSIAAPTASLHISESMLTFLQNHFPYTFVTLHVGAATFKPINVDSILEHKIHSEYCSLTKESAEKIKSHQKILCVGTTALRCVEWFIANNSHRESFPKNQASKQWQLYGENTLFFHPFNKPKSVHALLTNFHLPKSSLLLLVSSLIGREETLRIYAKAIESQYRFYSYGDGMLII